MTAVGVQVMLDNDLAQLYGISKVAIYDLKLQRKLDVAICGFK
jgi:hypothetical protein